MFRPLLAIGSVVLLGILLGACGGGSDGAAPDDVTATTTATSAAMTPSASPNAPAPSTPTPVPGVAAVDYSDDASWLCKPGKTGTPCTQDLDATVFAADGSSTIERWTGVTDAPVDCFYVYPTVSADAGVNSDLVPGGGENNATLNQAARFGSICRVFAPIYRQVTLTALTSGRFGDATARNTAYGDVLAAWRHYLANENEGRGVVLIGHSQGSMHLLRLMREYIDSDPAARELLVSAILAGTSVRVPGPGADVGGDFANIPACRAVAQVGCVVSWATFSEESPPPAGSFFGRAAGGQALCVNAAAPGGGPGDMRVYFAASGHSLFTVGGTPITTPFAAYDGIVQGQCVADGAFSYLSVETSENLVGLALPANINGAVWGLHNIDVNVALGNLVEMVAAQAAAWERR